MTERRTPFSDYVVGYGRPPEKTRFKPGQSGNPRGRPKGREQTKNRLRALYGALIPIQDGERQRSITRLEAVLLKQWERAVRGNDRATQGAMAAAKWLGLFNDPKLNDVDRVLDLSEAEIALLSDKELDELINIERQRAQKIEECKARLRAN